MFGNSLPAKPGNPWPPSRTRLFVSRAFRRSERFARLESKLRKGPGVRPSEIQGQRQEEHAHSQASHTHTLEFVGAKWRDVKGVILVSEMLRSQTDP